MTLVDTNVLIDILGDDPEWAAWSTEQLITTGQAGDLTIAPINFAELSARFNSPADVRTWLDLLDIHLIHTPAEALFRAGKAFAAYRQAGGPRTSMLADFLIGAHAEVMDVPILTRDTRRFRTYFPTVRLIAPDAS